MSASERTRVWRPGSPVLAALVAIAAGCGATEYDDFSRANSGQHLKTPTEVRQEAEAKYGKRKPADAQSDAKAAGKSATAKGAP